ncbi:trypsin-like peptidase domain-containing protein [Streptomyces sp. AC536]|uniref:S1C family serine protease n=1 Tax=Streptomyces buecherae TaxID=2763006 RepID=UPI00164CE6AE|nr:trypsin-like peptidase domain-containing protein [Streptomyces buecherae]MBC3984801.1 trypsin-like peptidase domain-containing protein [Streptomyces buecherae]QNJ41308.1 trypsin-like peptidase domain-containing protein [Streptomyces buecherae]
MSTENEGAAVPPETEPRTAPPAPPAAPGAEHPAPDYGLAPPTTSAPAESTPRPTAPDVAGSAPGAGADPARSAPDAETVAGAPVAHPTAEITSVDTPARQGGPAGPPADAGRTPAPLAEPTPAARSATTPGHPAPHAATPHGTVGGPPAGGAGGADGAGGAGGGGWWSGGGQPYGPGGGPGDPHAPWGAGAPGPVPPRRGRGGILAGVLAAVLVAGGIGGGIGFWAAERDKDNESTTISATGEAKSTDRAPGSVSAIADKTLPSVVTIEAQSTSGEGGTGTGFVYDKQGHLLTNNHVVASAADSGELRVTFSNGKKYRAEVVGRAEGYDIAVLKLKDAPGGLTPLPLADSDKVEVGDGTVAIGAPFGLSGTVTTGIVSAKKRPVSSSDGGGSKASYMSALQTDASINPGNSGGPLLNDSGAVIGVNSAIQPAGGGGGFGGQGQQSGSIGLGFAIPINQAKQVAEQLIKTGQPVYPVIEATVNMKDTGAGATISRQGQGTTDPITPGGPADKAGLRAGDVITKLDDTVIDSGPTLISEIWTHRPGDKVVVTFLRDGKENKVQVTLGERKGDS